MKTVGEAMDEGGNQEKLRAVMAMLIECQFTAEKQAGLADEEPPEPPAMRLRE